MNIAAYCRVSTDKEDQLNSLETQKEFFLEYTKRTGDNLIKLYADEGISGTKIKNRKEFQRMLADAEKGLFDMVVVKDISRFARNTVDLLQSVRKLKSLGIETQFLTANMTSMGNSEFVLTIFGALAQEESANTSKRIKFGKKMNAEKGRVPNIVYGYDKTIGDYFNLSINEEEARVIRQMYKWYTEEGFGGAKIANMLNERGVKTKRGNNWSQNSVCRILTNEIYTGKIINGKEEVADFLTGQRKEKDESEWLVTVRPELRIIDDETFDKAQEILKGRHDSFKMTHERQSNKHLFSTLIKCKDCGWSFRRIVRQYKNTYIRWVCSGHNGRGADSCPNAITVDEEELIQVLQEYFQDVLSKKKKVIDHVIKEFQRVYKAKDENVEYEKELTVELNRLRRSREKYMDMYTDDLISREELNEKIGGMRKEIDRLENELKMVSYNLTKGEQLEAILNSTFKEMEDITDVHEMTNTQLKRLINKIEVDKEGNVDIYMRLIGDLGLDETVLIEGTESADYVVYEAENINTESSEHQENSTKEVKAKTTKKVNKSNKAKKVQGEITSTQTVPNSTNHT
ncbi:MAG: recombinase family protein [Lachnospiraceae bacterium]|nr:recombinase family protein [Lachnospiraceae bacterium]